MADREFLLKIVGDVTGAQKAIDTLDRDVQGFKTSASGIGKAVVGALSIAAIAKFGTDIVDAASSQEQALGAVNSVFGEYADKMSNFGDQTASQIGLSKTAFLDLATVTGALLKNAGLPLDKVTGSTLRLTNQAADMAAMFGGTVEDAMSAINSGLKGEADPLEKYGISLKASAIEAKALAMGLVDAEGKVTDQGKAMARMELIYEQAADSTGTFAAESGTLAGQTAIMKAQFADLQADLGAKLLPVFVKVMGVIRGLVEFVTANQSWLVPLIGGIAAIALGMWAWTAATAAWATATTIATAIQTAFNFVMALNPIALVVLAIVALVAAIVVAYKNVGWFRDLVDKAFDAIVGAFNWLKDAGETAIRAIVRAFDWIVDKAGVVGGLISTAVALYTWPFRTAYDIIVGIFKALPQAFTNVLNAVSFALGWVWSIISAPFQTAIDLVKGIISGLGTAWQTVVDGVKSALNGIATAIKAPFKTAFDGIKAIWNSTVGGFSFKVPGWIPGVGGKGFSIPEMAAGGIVTKPMIALLGEAGPEAVIPLDGSHALGGGNVTINVYALTANAEVGRKVHEALREYDRMRGTAA